ncbi:MAG TPA: class I SAM-dependent methyltransferase [Candidatus Paceibacterota bacterium]
MSYYSDVSYASRDPWFMRLYFNRWFKETKGPILDVACSVGHFIAIAPNQIEGIDKDEDSLRKARAQGFNVRRIDIDKGEMSTLPGGHYEGVYASQIIEHLAHPLSFMKEIHRVLTPGGRAVILTPNIPYMLPHFWDDYTHIRPFTKAALTMIARDAGFVDVNVREDFRTMPLLGRLMRAFSLPADAVARVQHVLGIRGTSLILLARK